MNEVRAGVWHWQAPHPDWKPDVDWPELVSSYAIEDEGRLLLFDPLGVPDEILERAREREAVILLTCPWHTRDARDLAGRLAARIFVPPPDEGDPDPTPGEVYRAGDRLPVGVEALAGMEPNDLVLWHGGHGVLVVGDTLLDRGSGLEIPVDWAREGITADDIREELQPLLDLPIELVLPTHGAPTDRDALERALS